MAKQLGRKPQQLIDLTAIKLPEELEYLWVWYHELFNGGKISYLELEAWSRLTRRSITHWETGVIKNLDSIYLKVQNDGR